MYQGALRAVAVGMVLMLLVPVGLQAAPATFADDTRIIIELNEGATLLDVPLARASRAEVRRLNPQSGRALRRWWVVKTPVNQAMATLENLKSNPAVVEAHVAQTYTTAQLPNDTQFTKQWGLSSVSGLADIHAPQAWDRTTGSGDTVIAVIDGGVDITHEDLRGKLWTNSREVPGNNSDDDGNGYVDDVHGWDFVTNRTVGSSVVDHATHVAGIAAAHSNNGTGVAGVDWQARIMSLRALAGSGLGYEDNIIGGIAYATHNGADVINLSLVGPPSDAMQAAIEAAYNAGVVVVAAAGNSGRNVGNSPIYPVCADQGKANMVLGVAALAEDGEPAGFSNYGSCVDVAAPGAKIYSTTAGNDYGTMSGTSMAAPFAAGVAGLYKAVHPGASAAEIISAVKNGDAFTEADWNVQYGSKLNAAKVVGTGSSNAEPAPAPSGGSGDGGGNSGGGGGGGSDGGGGGGGGEEEPQTKKPAVKGIRTDQPIYSAALRKAPDFIKNPNVPAVVARLFQTVFGKKITPAESTYWKKRARYDKPTETTLRGAMQWQKNKGTTKGK